MQDIFPMNQSLVSVPCLLFYLYEIVEIFCSSLLNVWEKEET